MEVKVEVTGEQTRYFFTDDAYHKSQKTVLITRFTFHVSRFTREHFAIPLVLTAMERRGMKCSPLTTNNNKKRKFYVGL